MIIVVLFSIHFWGSAFILPQSVVKEVDMKCREYLWGSTAEKWEVSLIAWDRICVPKRNGELTITGCRLWNMASVGKLWQIVMKKDSIG